MTSSPVIRPLTLAETEELVGWAEGEGWNPGLADAAAFYAADPEGFIGCFVDGKMAAGISAVRYGEDFGFIGLYIAHPDFRGQGYGRKVWDAGMAYLDGCTIGLDGVPEQQANYRSMGFEPVYETVRWSGSISGAKTAGTDALNGVHGADVLAYDRAIFPADRSAFLEAWLKPPRIGKVVLSEGRIAGYAICRGCRDGYKIGPLFADGIDEAVLLLNACASEAGGEALHIDVPEMQVEFAAVLQQLGFSRGFLTARMYRGAPPATPIERVFGITTLELG